MKQSIFTFILLVLASVTFSQNPVNVSAIEFNQHINSEEGIILDVRTPQEYSRGHLPSSTLISVADPEFVNKIKLLQKDKPIYIYCLTGSRSRMAANYMAKNGFSKIYNLQRGILEWQRSGLPVEKSQQQIASKAVKYTNDSFNQLIQSSNLVFVDFHAPWCAPCKKMSPIIDEVKKDYTGKVRVEKIDVESNRTIAEANNIESIPGFILFQNGKQVWIHKGVISKEELEKLLNKFI